MSRTQIIMLSVLGLMIIGVVFWCISAFSSGKSKSVDSNSNTLTDVPEKFTYQDMMKSAGDKGFNLDEAPKTGKSIIAAGDETVLNAVSSQQDNGMENSNNVSAASSQLPVDPPQISSALAEVQQARKTIKAAVQKQQQEDDAEDEKIRQIVAERGQTNVNNVKVLPPEPQRPSIVTDPKGANTLVAGGSTSHLPSSKALTSIKGVILNDVEVASGSTVRIMLLETTTINGVQLRKTEMVTGTVGTVGNSSRIPINVLGAAIDGQLAAITFSIYGIDGIEGLPVTGNTGAATQQAAREEIERGVEGAAGNGVLGGVVRVAKTLGANRQRQTIVRIPAGSKVILKTADR